MIKLGVVAGIAVLVLAGCGTETSSTPESSTTSASESASTPPSSAAPDLTALVYEAAGGKKEFTKMCDAEPSSWWCNFEQMKMDGNTQAEVVIKNEARFTDDHRKEVATRACNWVKNGMYNIPADIKLVRCTMGGVEFAYVYVNED